MRDRQDGTPTLASLFAGLATPRESQGEGLLLTAAPVPGLEPHRIARGSDDRPRLLLSVPGQSTEFGHPVVLENMSVRHDVLCEITRTDSSRQSGRFCVVTCTSDEGQVREYFLRVMESVVAALGPAPTRPQVEIAIQSLVRLFRALSLPQKKSVQGLWAELWLIARSRDPVALAAAWHATPASRFDFNAGSQRIEVKSASGRTRQHYFTFEQMRPPTGTSACVASIFVEPSGGGLSLGDLLARLRGRLGGRPDLAFRAEVVAAETLGTGLHVALGDRFDEELAKESLRLYDARTLPSVCETVPVGIAEVRFRADLNSCTSIAHGQAAEGPLFAALGDW